MFAASHPYGSTPLILAAPNGPPAMPAIGWFYRVVYREGSATFPGWAGDYTEVTDGGSYLRFRKFVPQYTFTLKADYATGGATGSINSSLWSNPATGTENYSNVDWRLFDLTFSRFIYPASYEYRLTVFAVFS